MQSMKQLRKRVISINETLKIMSAVSLISKARLAKTRYLLEINQKYKNIFIKCMQCMNFENVRTNRKFCIVITSDKGLNGAYNYNLFKEFDKKIKLSDDINFYVIGKKGIEYFKRNKIEFLGSANNIMEDFKQYEVRQVIDNIIKIYNENKFSEILVLYNEFNSILIQTPIIKRIFPFKKEEKNLDIEEEFIRIYPSSEDIVNKVIPMYLKNIILSLILEATISSYAAQMTTMDFSIKNAEEMVEDLKSKYNKVRKYIITKNLSEIVQVEEFNILN